MVFEIIKKIVGTRNDRELKLIQRIVEQVNGWEEKIAAKTWLKELQCGLAPETFQQQ